MTGKDVSTEKAPSLPAIAALAVWALKYVAYAGVVVCAAGLSLASLHAYPLWFNSTKAEGVISGYKTVSWQSRRVFGGAVTSPTSANLPVITFLTQTGERVVFVDGHGHTRLATPGAKVAVIYEAGNPSNAIADNGWKNWMSIYIWLFGLVASALGVLRFRNMDGREYGDTADGSTRVR